MSKKAKIDNDLVKQSKVRFLKAKKSSKVEKLEKSKKGISKLKSMKKSKLNSKKKMNFSPGKKIKKK